MRDIEWCIAYLKGINHIRELPDIDEWALFRALLNITMPIDLSEEFYRRQDAVLQGRLQNQRIIDISVFPMGIFLYKGDITLLKADAIVNACNSQMLGCFKPGHHCIDNAIHSFGGLEIRRDLMKVMDEQGHDEPNGQCKVSEGYNLPAKYVLHTVGPVYSGRKQDDFDLANCYISCLQKADEMGLKNVVFCSLSTGIFGFPIEKACKIAIKNAKNYLKHESKNIERVVFDVFSEEDYGTYARALKETD